MAEPARFRERSRTVTAVQLEVVTVIETAAGALAAAPGDWVVTWEDGTQQVCNDAAFQLLYEPLPPAEQRPAGHHCAMDKEEV